MWVGLLAKLLLQLTTVQRGPQQGSEPGLTRLASVTGKASRDSTRVRWIPRARGASEDRAEMQGSSSVGLEERQDAGQQQKAAMWSAHHK